MATKRKFRTGAFEAIHSSASALYKVGAIDKTTFDKITMRSFDASCLTTPAPPQTRASQEASPGASCQSAGVRALSQHQRIDN